MDACLIVDDSVESIMVVQKIIKRIYPQIKILMATSGEEALKLVANTKSSIAIAFVDYNLENANGITVMIRMKKYFPANHMVLYTADTSPEIITQVKKLGSHYLAKPLTEANLKTLVDGLD